MYLLTKTQSSGPKSECKCSKPVDALAPSLSALTDTMRHEHFILFLFRNVINKYEYMGAGADHAVGEGYGRRRRLVFTKTTLSIDFEAGDYWRAWKNSPDLR